MKKIIKMQPVTEHAVFPGSFYHFYIDHQASGTFSRADDKLLYGFWGRCYNKIKQVYSENFWLVGFGDIVKVKER